MDYYKIGQKIKFLRKSHGFSQEELAEKIDISTTHMSHIETGSTKLSLPVLVALAKALHVPTDELLNYSNSDAIDAAINEINSVLATCSAQQAKVIVELVKSAKSSMDQYL